MRTSCVKRDRTRLRLGWRQTAQTMHVARTGIELRSGFSSTSCNRAAAEERESSAPRTQMHKTLHRLHPLCQDHAMRRGQGHGCCCWWTDSVGSGARASFGESAARMQACKFQAGSGARVELSRWHWFLSSVIMQSWHALDKLWYDGCEFLYCNYSQENVNTLLIIFLLHFYVVEWKWSCGGNLNKEVKGKTWKK